MINPEPIDGEYYWVHTELSDWEICAYWGLEWFTRMDEGILWFSTVDKPIIRIPCPDEGVENV
jgi:hypothetical protein